MEIRKCPILDDTHFKLYKVSKRLSPEINLEPQNDFLTKLTKIHPQGKKLVQVQLNVFLCIIVQNRDVISETENEDLLPKMLGLGWGESAKLSALSPTHTIQVV